MKPQFTCRSCSAELEWGMSHCPSCGKTLEWPGWKQEKTEKSAGSSGGVSSVQTRSIIAVVAVIAVGVIVLESLTGPSRVPAEVAQGAPMQQSAGGANMAALPHIQELEAKLQGDPSNQELRRELANHLMDNRFYDRAIAVYRALLDKDPSDANVRVDLGICYKELGNFESAEAEMRTALTYAPRHIHGHFNLAIVKLVQGDVQAAADWFRKTAELDPEGELGRRAKQLLEQHMSVNTQ